jgi:glucose-6-phosphate 1-dehydrogenase
MASPSEPLTPTLAGGPLASPEPATFVIFGATGDLSQRMLLPALYRLVREREVPDAFAVVGFARRAMSHEQFHAFAREAVIAAEGEPAMPDWERFAGRLYYAAGGFGDAAGYAGLGTLLGQVERDHGTGRNRVYYLAAPPSTYEEILGLLGEHRLVAHGGRDGARNHLIIEKPFGRDQTSAQRLNQIVARVIGEECVFRIDHYLGKETVQNMLVFRFANSIFEPFWNRRYVDHVQITFFEDIGIGRRGRFYEEVGVVRDVIQNHMFQLLAIVALEPPALFDAYGFRNEKAKVLRAIRPLGPEDAVRGQYGPGVMNGAKVPGYRQESDVQPGTVTPTFAAMKLYIDNWRWAGVPFYLRAGKRLARKDTEVAIVFRQPPLQLFRDYEMAHMEPNTLVLNTTQEEGISLGFAVRVPGHRREIRTVPLDFRYSELGEAEHSAYEHLLLEVLRGDQTLFPRSDEVELQWAAVDPLLAYWAAQPPKDFPNYPAGSSGPAAADELIRRDGRRWHNG